MPYSSGAVGRAIAAVSIKAGLIGSSIWAGLFGLIFLANQPFSFSGFWVSIFLAVLTFMISFAVGGVAIALCLMLFGHPIAKLSTGFLESAEGMLICFASAFAALGVLSGAVFFALGGSPLFFVLALPYAIPAAILFRSEILLERALD